MNMEKDKPNAKKLAFPLAVDGDTCDYLGLTKRELFAAMAMQGFFASGRTNVESVAEDSGLAADALLAELNME